MLTMVMSRSSMNIATQVASSVHHLRSIYLSAPLRSRQPAELLAHATIEARARELGEAADGVPEADRQLLAGAQVPRVLPVERDLDRVTSGGVLDVEHVLRGHHQRSRGERMRGDEADHEPLHAPGQD